MDRRLFLTGLLGLAGAGAVATVLKPAEALAGIANPGGGILDQIDAPEPMAEVEEINHRHGHRHHRRRRRQRRRVWRRVCRRERFDGRWIRRCRRRRVWAWYWL